MNPLYPPILGDFCSWGAPPDTPPKGFTLGYHYNATLAGPAIPTVSEWGMVLMSLLVLTAGTLVYGRRAPACP